MGYGRSRVSFQSSHGLVPLKAHRKTQLALDIAHTIKEEWNVFWIRADSFASFVTDYVRASELMFGTDGADIRQAATSPQVAKNKFNACVDAFLIILDNADNLDEFSGGGNNGSETILDYLPNSGCILITTRDQRFQGVVVPATNGINVQPMERGESETLLRSAIPPHLLQKTGEKTEESVQFLLHKLGDLPLAIAQAAANIVEQQFSLTEYAVAYEDTRNRMGLMEVPIYDVLNEDPTSRSQSIAITWETSFAYLETSHQLASLCLSYMGFLDNEHIPRRFLMKFPPFRNLDILGFQKVVKKLIHLSLIQVIEENHPDLGPAYYVHPVVHERISVRLSRFVAAKLAIEVAEILLETIPILFPKDLFKFMHSSLLVPHAMRLFEYAWRHKIGSSALCTLQLRIANFVQFQSRSEFMEVPIIILRRTKNMVAQRSNLKDRLTVAIHLISALITASISIEAEAEVEAAEKMIREAEENVSNTESKSLDCVEEAFELFYLKSVVYEKLGRIDQQVAILQIFLAVCNAQDKELFTPTGRNADHGDSGGKANRNRKEYDTTNQGGADGTECGGIECDTENIITILDSRKSELLLTFTKACGDLVLAQERRAKDTRVVQNPWFEAVKAYMTKANVMSSKANPSVLNHYTHWPSISRILLGRKDAAGFVDLTKSVYKWFVLPKILLRPTTMTVESWGPVWYLCDIVLQTTFGSSVALEVEKDLENLFSPMFTTGGVPITDVATVRWLQGYGNRFARYSSKPAYAETCLRVCLDLATRRERIKSFEYLIPGLYFDVLCTMMQQRGRRADVYSYFKNNQEWIDTRLEELQSADLPKHSMWTVVAEIFDKRNASALHQRLNDRFDMLDAPRRPDADIIFAALPGFDEERPAFLENVFKPAFEKYQFQNPALARPAERHTSAQ